MTLLDDDDTVPTDEQLALDVRRVAVAQWAGATTIGHVRSANEDAWGHRGTVYVVADGMGGHEGGALAATAAVEALLEDVEPSDWRDHVAAVNLRVRAVCAQQGVDDAGTTAVVVKVRADRATVVSAGDSRVYRLRDGHIEQLTADHNVGTELMSAGIDAHARRRQGVRTGGLTSFLGIAPIRLRVDVIDVDVIDGDMLVMMTDGVFGQLPDARLASLMAGCDARTAANALVQAADDAGGRDNSTVIVMTMTRDEGSDRWE